MTFLSREASDAVRYWSASLLKQIEALTVHLDTEEDISTVSRSEVIAAIKRHTPPADD